MADNLAVKRIMRLVTAVVTAAIANLAFYLAKPALFTVSISASHSRLDWVALLWLAVSVALLWRLGLNVVLLVILSALFGLGRHALSFSVASCLLLAGFIPAPHGASIDPMQALRAHRVVHHAGGGPLGRKTMERMNCTTRTRI